MIEPLDNPLICFFESVPQPLGRFLRYDSQLGSVPNDGDDERHVPCPVDDALFDFARSAVFIILHSCLSVVFVAANLASGSNPDSLLRLDRKGKGRCEREHSLPQQW